MRWFSQVLEDLTPRQLVVFHKWGFVLWVLLLVPTLLWWGNALMWTQLMSLYAIIITHACGYPAARAELKVEETQL